MKDYLREIWPTIYRIINAIFFFIVSVVKEIFRLAFRQMRDE